ncbi:MAG: P-II family nitrogen regulator [Nitrospirae bacterium]|nr:P-II family nitrogen regulator [Nitrospirota bacterium]MBI5695490.1 P-II family nitrogen regulator [Nitrospirota bacterium]
MKEIMAVIRQSKVKQTMEALADIGVTSVTIHNLNGRGKQGGNIMECVDPLMSTDVECVSKIYKFPTPSSMAVYSKLTKPVFWVPKSLLDIVISEVPEDLVVEAIMKVNRTGNKGDGKVFVMPIADALRIRTGERGDAAIV